MGTKPAKVGRLAPCLLKIVPDNKSPVEKHVNKKPAKKRAIRRYTLHRSCVMGSPCKQSSATLSLSLSLSLSIRQTAPGGYAANASGTREQRLAQTQRQELQGKHAANASTRPIHSHAAAAGVGIEKLRMRWRYAANASDASNAWLTCIGRNRDLGASVAVGLPIAGASWVRCARLRPA